MEGQLGLSELSVITWVSVVSSPDPPRQPSSENETRVSAVEGCPLRGVLLSAPSLHTYRLCDLTPSITDTIGARHFVLYSEVSLNQGLPAYFR